MHAAAGGIGQLAKLLGAGRVIATAGSPDKLDIARSHGASVAVDYSTEDWPERVREAAPDGARPREAMADMVELTDYFATGRLHATVHTRLPLTEAAEAHRILEARTHLGRVLLVP